MNQALTKLDNSTCQECEQLRSKSFFFKSDDECDFHKKCFIVDCNRNHKKSNLFCTFHICRCGFLKNIYTTYCSYCRHHEYVKTLCISKTCENQKIPNHLYCQDHLCRYENCVIPRLNESKYCEAHIDYKSLNNSNIISPHQELKKLRPLRKKYNLIEQIFTDIHLDSNKYYRIIYNNYHESICYSTNKLK